MNQKSNIMEYITFYGGINGDGASKSKKNHQLYLMTKYIKSVFWGVAVPLSFIKDTWCLKVN